MTQVKERYRDVKDLNVLGDAFTGAMEVTTAFNSDTFDFAADDNINIQRTDITGIFIEISMTIRDPQFKRDLRNVRFGITAFTADNTTDVMTSVAHGLSDDDIINIFSKNGLVSGVVPAGLAEDVDYYIITATNDTFQISLTEGGGAIDFSDDGTGTHFFGTTVGIVNSMSMTNSSTDIPDSAEEDKFLTFIGITDRVIEATIDSKNIRQNVVESLFAIAQKRDIEVDVLPGDARSGLCDLTAFERILLKNMTITGIELSTPHGDLASGSVSLRGGDPTGAIFNNTTSDSNPTGFEKNPGDVGTITFTVPTADGGSDLDITVVNCVLTSSELSLAHGEGMERTFTFKAFSVDGQVSPLSFA